MLEQLKEAQGRLVGTKQVLRGLTAGRIQKVFVAEDADEFIYRRVMAAAEAAQTPVVRVKTMKELGQACRVEVAAAAAGILK
ncbi:MAG: ribosomal L7Ae/L30e/S12e/Gadd45 family protein [Clostridia bacterium]|nr:ribosomal L7Ae/L30e/S12e/Gadd45 family protein [Clostridia bacterium]